MRGPQPWVLFYVPLMWNAYAMQDMQREGTDNTDNTEDIYHVIFVRKYKTFLKNIPGAHIQLFTVH